MTVQQRILALCLLEKQARHKAYMNKIGVNVTITYPAEEKKN